MKKKKVPFFVKALGVIVLAGMLGTLLMTLIYTIPTSRIRAKLSGDVDLLYGEGDFPSVAPNFEYARPDGSTDALMLNEASYQDEGSGLLELAVTNPSCFDLSDSEQRTHILKLALASENCNPAYRQNYGRYWHGYLLILKPALSVMSLQSLRLIGIFGFFAAVTALLIFVYKYLGRRYIFGIFFAVLLLNPITTALSFQFWSVFYICLIASCLVLAKYEWLSEKTERIYYLFLFSGIAVAFFDYLTYPIVACFVPLIFYLTKRWRAQSSDLRNDLRLGLKLVVAWALGWIGMWASKWLIGSTLTGQNILSEAIGATNYRLGGEIIGDTVSWYKAIATNLRVLLIPPILLLVLAFMLILLHAIIIKGYRLSKQLAKERLILLLVALAPLVWYVVVANHSQYHHFFTYKNLVISALAICYYFTAILLAPKKKRRS